MLDIYKLYENVIFFRALYVCCDLGIPDYLKLPKSIEELAQKLSCNQGALTRLMRVLIASGIFEQDEQGFYKHNESSIVLCEKHPDTVKPLVLHEDPTRWNALGNLKHSIQYSKFRLRLTKCFFDEKNRCY